MKHDRLTVVRGGAHVPIRSDSTLKPRVHLLGGLVPVTCVMSSGGRSLFPLWSHGRTASPAGAHGVAMRRRSPQQTQLGTPDARGCHPTRRFLYRVAVLRRRLTPSRGPRRLQSSGARMRTHRRASIAWRGVSDGPKARPEHPEPSPRPLKPRQPAGSLLGAVLLIFVPWGSTVDSTRTHDTIKAGACLSVLHPRPRRGSSHPQRHLANVANHRPTRPSLCRYGVSPPVDCSRVVGRPGSIRNAEIRPTMSSGPSGTRHREPRRGRSPRGEPLEFRPRGCADVAVHAHRAIPSSRSFAWPAVPSHQASSWPARGITSANGRNNRAAATFWECRTPVQAPPTTRDSLRPPVRLHIRRIWAGPCVGLRPAHARDTPHHRPGGASARRATPEQGLDTRLPHEGFRPWRARSLSSLMWPATAIS